MSSNPPTLSPLGRELRTLLETSDWGRPLRAYRSTTSTNTVARQWVDEGAPEGSLVVAEEQTAGRGRLGRRWHAQTGKNLLFSLILHPKLPVQQWGLITLAASIAAAEVIEPVITPYQPAIKWPNDILINNQKCCGMLLESLSNTGRCTAPSVVILGIGLNINQVQFPPEAAPQATSLRLTSGRIVERAPFLVQLLRALRRWYRRLQDDGPQVICEAFAQRMIFTNKTVTLQHATTQKTFTGVVQGIDPSGALKLKRNGQTQTFHAGEVSVHQHP